LKTNSGSRDEIDIYIDVHPRYYVEIKIKYVRPITSGMNCPLPQHRGKLWRALCSSGDRRISHDYVYIQHSVSIYFYGM